MSTPGLLIHSNCKNGNCTNYVQLGLFRSWRASMKVTRSRWMSFHLLQKDITLFVAFGSLNENQKYICRVYKKNKKKQNRYDRSGLLAAVLPRASFSVHLVGE